MTWFRWCFDCLIADLVFDILLCACMIFGLFWIGWLVWFADLFTFWLVGLIVVCFVDVCLWLCLVFVSVLWGDSVWMFGVCF